MEQIPNPPSQFLPGLSNLSSKTSLNKRNRFLPRNATSLDYLGGGRGETWFLLHWVALCGSVPGTRFVVEALINARLGGVRAGQEPTVISQGLQKGCGGAVLGGWVDPNPVEMISAGQEGDSGLG